MQARYLFVLQSYGPAIGSNIGLLPNAVLMVLTLPRTVVARADLACAFDFKVKFFLLFDSLFFILMAAIPPVEIVQPVPN
ncbi:MAG: hypothetical protein DKT66_09070 [Candidatus Melainabacteria bacterium]|nr:MAG: hypothetical protein DKT66_09070 [Candidatus Melainabacteria bacterium]